MASSIQGHISLLWTWLRHLRRSLCKVHLCKNKLPTSCTSSTLITITQVFGEFGIPETFLSDSGLHFSITAFQAFGNNWGFKQNTTSPHYPKSNGLADIYVQTVKSILKKAESSKQDPDLVLRTRPTDAKILSPARLVSAQAAGHCTTASVKSKSRPRCDFQTTYWETG